MYISGIFSMCMCVPGKEPVEGSFRCCNIEEFKQILDK